MMTYFSVAAALVLFAGLAAYILRSKYETSLLGARLDDSSGARTCDARCGEDVHVAGRLLSRVFSGEDEEFVVGLNSSRLERLLVQERKRLALHWVSRKVVEARGIMREHAQAARTARDLQISGELQLFARYLELRALCGLLFILVTAFGPAGMQRLAAETDALFLRIRGGRTSTAGLTAG
jgi:hypothetical protein